MNTYAYWKILAWRLLRGAVAAGLTQIIALHPNWADPKAAVTMLAVSFLSGFFLALGMGLRDWLSQGDKTSLWNRLPF